MFFCNGNGRKHSFDGMELGRSQQLNQLHQFQQFFNKTNFFVLVEKNCGLMVDELVDGAVIGRRPGNQQSSNANKFTNQ